MKSIREFFENLYNNVQNDSQFDEVMNYECAVYNKDDKDFEEWARENDINLTARDERTGELVVTLWCWDMCDE